MKPLTNGDKWEDGHAVIKTLMFLIGSVYLSPTNVKGLYPLCADQLLSFGRERVIEIEEREWTWIFTDNFSHLNAELNPICRLLALLRAHHIFHVSGLRVNSTYFFFTCALFKEGVIVSVYLVYIPNTPSLYTKTKLLTLFCGLHKFLKNLEKTSNFWAPVGWHKASFILRTHEY